MVKLKSSIPGLKYPSGREDPLKSGQGFLDGRRRDDGAEGLWRIGDKLYDLENWMDSHPGGSEWLELTKGTDITEAYEVHHLTDRPDKLLPKFYVRQAVTPRTTPFTFSDDGFYKKFKKRALKALEKVDYHNPAKITNLITDSLLATTFISSMIAAATNFWPLYIFSGVCLAYTTIASHNYLHMKQNPRMYYFDLSLMTSKDWRITHALCHHLYPNTIWDQEMYASEPLIYWLSIDKKVHKRLIGVVVSPLFWFMGFLRDAFKRYYMVFFVWKKFQWRDLVPFTLPLVMCLVAPNPILAFKSWIMIIICASFTFHSIGVNAAHHHPDIFHDGDIYREDLDWGLLAIDTVRGRDIIDDHHFLTLTNFGTHTLHHLIPTVDHAYLPLCQKAFEETCKEFGIRSPDKLHPLELLKGQFLQQIRTKEMDNCRK